MLTGADPLMTVNNPRFNVTNGDLIINATNWTMGEYDLQGATRLSGPNLNTTFTGTNVTAYNTRPNTVTGPSTANRAGNAVIHMISYSVGGDTTLNIETSNIHADFGQGLASHATNTGDAFMTVKNSTITLGAAPNTLGNAIIVLANKETNPALAAIGNST